MFGIQSIEVTPPKRVKRWYATRSDSDDTGVEFDYTIEIFSLDDRRYEVYVYQLGMQILNGWNNSLSAAKRSALLDTGFKSKDFEWIVTDINE